MEDGTIGLVNEQRSDFEMRNIFVDAYDLVVPFMNADGSWISTAHESLAHDAGHECNLPAQRAKTFYHNVEHGKHRDG